MESNPNKIEVIERNENLVVAENTIKKARQRTEEEFKRTGNPWLAAFRTDLTTLATRYWVAFEDGALSESKHNQINEFMSMIVRREGELKPFFNGPAQGCPQEIKDELLGYLDQLLKIQNSPDRDGEWRAAGIEDVRQD